MLNKNRYKKYLHSLYAYGDYNNTPDILNFSNLEISYILNGSKKDFFDRLIYPNIQSVKNHLKTNSFSNGIWEGNHGIYTTKNLNDVGVIGIKNIKVVNYNK